MPYVSKPSFQKMLAKCLNIAVLSQLLTSLVAQMVKCLHTMQETHVQSQYSLEYCLFALGLLRL